MNSIKQLAANATSFDAAIKQRIACNERTKIPINYTSLDPSKFLKAINLCMSPLGRASAQTLCDFRMAMVYELCQAIPDKLSYICIMPSINSYLKDRNMVDGQTDKLVWQSLLHSKEITANPYGNSNSTGISNSMLIPTPVLVTAGANASSNSTNSTNAFSAFENKDFHFKMSYPTNWTWQTTGLVAHLFMRLHTSNPQAEIAVWARNTGKSFTLAD